jgi:hypothetical protein
MNRRAPHYGSKKRTKAEGELELINFLYCARPHMILAATAEELARRYGTDARETAEALKLAQERVG